MLTLDAVDAFYGRSHALHGVSLGIPAGGITAILGRNGVGKPTLLKTLMGLMERVTGTIRLAGRDITRTPAYRRARAGIAYVPQGREIIPDFTIRENILMGAFARRAGHHFAMMEKGRAVAEGGMAELTDTLMQRHMAV